MSKEWEPGGEEELSNEAVNPTLISDAGMWHVLRSLDDKKLRLFHMMDGNTIEGTKRWFDEQLGIVCILTKHSMPIQTTLDTEKPLMEDVFVEWQCRLSDVRRIGRKVNIKSN